MGIAIPVGLSCGVELGEYLGSRVGDGPGVIVTARIGLPGVPNGNGVPDK